MAVAAVIENPASRIGMIAQKRAEIHFMCKGYSVCWPAVDNGFDLLIHKSHEATFGVTRVQVKNMQPCGSVRLNGQTLSAGFGEKRADRVRRARHAAAKAERPYDVLAVVCDEYIWVIPEAETRGITTIGFKILNGKRKGQWLARSKWHKFREERLDGRSAA